MTIHDSTIIQLLVHRGRFKPDIASDFNGVKLSALMCAAYAVSIDVCSSIEIHRALLIGSVSTGVVSKPIKNILSTSWENIEFL